MPCTLLIFSTIQSLYLLVLLASNLSVLFPANSHHCKEQGWYAWPQGLVFCQIKPGLSGFAQAFLLSTSPKKDTQICIMHRKRRKGENLWFFPWGRDVTLRQNWGSTFPRSLESPPFILFHFFPLSLYTCR